MQMLSYTNAGVRIPAEFLQEITLLQLQKSAVFVLLFQQTVWVSYFDLLFLRRAANNTPLKERILLQPVKRTIKVLAVQILFKF